MTDARILGIESSCDETAAAVVAGGREILSSIVASQFDIHRKYGGVVPELASREHLRRIVPVVREALEQAGIRLADVEAIAVTRGPGLIGSLLVGVTYGKVLAATLSKPLIAVNHLEGHVHAVLLEARAAGREPEFPAVCLVVSGGHTVLYDVEAESVSRNGARATALRYGRIGQTRDDAAGEAYDKVAKLLALGYPGGPILDRLAAEAARLGIPARPEAYGFTAPITRGNPFDFSFSGIKTAVLRWLQRQRELAPEIARREAALRAGAVKYDELRPLVSETTLALAAAFQRAVVEDLVARTLAAAEDRRARSVLVSGGVAANSELRAAFEREAAARGLAAYFPSRHLSTDNAAMIAAAAWPLYVAGQFAAPDLNAEAVLPLA